MKYLNNWFLFHTNCINLLIFNLHSHVHKALLKYPSFWQFRNWQVVVVVVVEVVVVLMVVVVVLVVVVAHLPHKTGQYCWIDATEHWEFEKLLHSIGSRSHSIVSQRIPWKHKKNFKKRTNAVFQNTCISRKTTTTTC